MANVMLVFNLEADTKELDKMGFVPCIKSDFCRMTHNFDCDGLFVYKNALVSCYQKLYYVIKEEEKEEFNRLKMRLKHEQR